MNSLFNFFKPKVPRIKRDFFVKYESESLSTQDLDEEYFLDNSVTTAKYNLFTFLPRSLFEQFRRLANIYFLIMGILMLIGTYTYAFDSPITPWSTILTLAIVLLISIGKEGVEDLKRHRADYLTNNQKAQIINRNPISKTPSNKDISWRNIRVGNIIKVYNNQELPADIILLTSSENHGIAYVETSNIDGESNLKIKMSAKTSPDGPKWSTIDPWISSNIAVSCALPDSSIHQFNGMLLINDVETIVDSASFLLRGCTLKNTQWIIGIVVYTGHQTKVIMNSRQVPSKLSFLERTINSFIYVIFFAQLLLSFISFITYIIWSKYNENDLPYLCYNSDSSVNSIFREFCDSSSEYNEVGYFVTFFILYNNFIPISLYVTIEMCNYFQASFIDSDLELYHEETDIPSMARTSNMNSDLGMIEYIFSDKTGTLTENIMKFKKCSIFGNIYYIDNVNETINPFEKPLDCLHEESDADNIITLKDFLCVLGLCHSAIFDDSSKELRTESPDEEALLFVSELLGWKFLGRTPTSIIVQETSTKKTKSFQLLATIPFDSKRKRMSVIIQHDDGSIVLYTKGADNVIFERLNKQSIILNRKLTMAKHLDSFAAEGLRTLVLAKRTLNLEEFETFNAKWKEAKKAMDNQQILFDQAASLVEIDLTLVAATGIEDKLQDQVPDTIADLISAGIKMWVLTGDKLETAINIGYSSKLLVKEMILLKMQYIGDRHVIRQKLEALIYHLQKLTKDLPLTISQEETVNYNDWFHRNISFLVNCFQSKDQSIETSKSYGDFSFHDLIGDSNISDTHHEATPLVAKEKSCSQGMINLEHISSDHLALIIDGETLLHILGDKMNEELFLAIAKICKSVIACRVSPEQKRLLVRLVKNTVHPKPVTLSIGDGANDVAMIQEAQIGVGISGREGRQAVNSSDFAIAKFKYLKRLLLVHGRLNYRRSSKVVLYSFYKNIVLSLVVFFYTFFSGYSGQSLFEDYVYGMYNIVLSLPVVAFGVLDRDICPSQLMQSTKHYEVGRKRKDLNSYTVIMEIIQALTDGLIIYFVPYFCYRSSKDIWIESGLSDGLWVFGTTVYSALVLAMFYRIAFITNTWTWINHFAFFGSIALYYIFLLSFQYMYSISYNFYGVTDEMLGHGIFWWILMIVPLMSISIKITISLITNVLSDIFSLEEAYLNTKTQDLEEPLNESFLHDRGSFSEEVEEPKVRLPWLVLQNWWAGISSNDQENLGVRNVDSAPMSSFNFDFVSSNLGPGAGLHYIFRGARNVAKAVFKITTPSHDKIIPES